MIDRGSSIEKAGRWVPVGLAGVLAAGFGAPLLRSPLLQGDLPGHLETIRWSAECLWPLPWGWDPRYLLGIPVGVLYPPLLGWLGGGIAELVGAEWALRVLLFSSILALPFALAAAGRGLGLRRGEAGWAAAAGLAVLWLPGRGLGGSLHQTLVAGNAANALALPLVFCYVGTLRRGLGRPSRWAAPAALLALILLTHFLMAMVSGCALAALALWGNPRRLRIRLARALLLGGTSLLGAAPFLVPFVAHFRDGSSDAIPFAPLPSAYEWTSLAALAVLVAMGGRVSRRVLGGPLLLAVAFYLLRGVVFPLAGAPPFRMEYHRFRLFLYLCLVPAAFLVLRARPWLRARRSLALVAPAVLVVALAVFARYDARGPDPVPMPRILPDLTGHRVLVLASPSAQRGSWHGLQYRLPRALGAHGAKGVFVEASPFSREVFEIEQIASAPGITPRWWAIRTAPLESLRACSDREVEDRFRDLGIDVVVAREPVAAVVQRIAVAPPEDLGEGYALYRLPAIPSPGRGRRPAPHPDDHRTPPGNEGWLGLGIGAIGAAAIACGAARPFLSDGRSLRTRS